MQIDQLQKNTGIFQKRKIKYILQFQCGKLVFRKLNPIKPRSLKNLFFVLFVLHQLVGH